MTQIEQYSENRFAKLSREIFNKNYRTNLGLHAQKLLYGLASCLNGDELDFPEWDIHIDGLFKYMNIENTNQRYEIVREAISEIARNPLEYKVSDKKWGGWSWLSMWKFNADSSNYVTIRFGDKVKPFLLELKQYCLLEVRYYVRLTSNYGMWLYPILRNVANKEKSYIDLTLKEIKELTYNDKKKAYNPKLNRNANTAILTRIIGIEKKRGAKHYTPIEKKQNDKYKAVGAIAEINNKTDLNVWCEVLKEGRAMNAIRFHVEFKPNTYQSKRKQIRKAHRTDYKKEGARQLVIEEIKKGVDLEPISVPIKTVEEMASAKNQTVGDLLREMGYIRDGDRAYKK